MLELTGMNKQTGFTIIELMIVLMIASILAVVAAPNMVDFLQNNTRTTRVNNFVSAFNIARSEAIKRSISVAVCESADLATCNTPLDGFQSGWIVFTDTDESGTVDVGTDDILRVYQPDMAGNAALKGLDADGNGVGAVVYQATGFPPDILNGVEFVYCDDRGASAGRTVKLSPTGHPSVSQTVTTCP